MPSLKIFVEEELAKFRLHRQHADQEKAWLALESAHILSQPSPWLHTIVHGHMMLYGIALGDWREVWGQILRIAVAGLGSWLGKAPRGNTGRASVPIMAVMDVSQSIAEKLSRASDSDER